MKMILGKAAKEALAARTKSFNSPGVSGRRKPPLRFYGPDAEAVGRAKYGDAVELGIRGRVVGRGTLGQRNEVVIEVDEVNPRRKS
jgi:hypothetical protein